MIYVTPTKTFVTLSKALSNGESFIATTDDHEYATFVDWEEFDVNDREKIYELGDLDEAEIEKVLVHEVNALDEDDRKLAIVDDMMTLIDWLEIQNIRFKT